MQVIGKNMSINSQGYTVTTLHLADDFNDYYHDEKAGRTCEGLKVESVYAGTLDCSAIKVGMNVDILYDKAVTTATGRVYQPIKRIDVID